MTEDKNNPNLPAEAGKCPCADCLGVALLADVAAGRRITIQPDWAYTARVELQRINKALALGAQAGNCPCAACLGRILVADVDAGRRTRIHFGMGHTARLELQRIVKAMALGPPRAQPTGPGSW
ncbi:MAG: hypothetical protein WC789_05835 [Lentisphaeria bacterium]|jgi:hypothetical protein